MLKWYKRVELGQGNFSLFSTKVALNYVKSEKVIFYVQIIF